MIIDVPKSRQRQTSKKLCFFCGLPEQMSKEHAWPQWLGRGVEVGPTQTNWSTGYGRTAENELTEYPSFASEKPGSVLTTRIREVCQRCNNGWMSQLETSVKPLLERLWQPTYVFGRIAVGVDDAAVLAVWAAKTAWIRERSSKGGVTPTAEMRRQLMDRQLPPEFTHVWIARHTGRVNFDANVCKLQTTHQDDPWGTERFRNILVCTLTFRGLSVLVRTDDGWGVPKMHPPDGRWRQFWPTAHAVQWPAARPVSDDDILDVAMRHDWVRHPDAPIFNRAPEPTETARG